MLCKPLQAPGAGSDDVSDKQSTFQKCSIHSTSFDCFVVALVDVVTTDTKADSVCLNE